MPDHGPRYATVGDYLRVLRRRRFMVAIIIVLATAIAIGLSLSQPTRYTTEAKVTFRDPLQDLQLLGQGTQVLPDQSPIQRANIQADLVTGPKVSRQVRKELDTEQPPGVLAGAIDTRVDPQTNLVIIEAAWSDAEFAAELANAFAETATKLGEEEARKRLEAAEDAIQDDLKDAKDQEPLPGIRISILEGNLQRLRGLKAITQPAEVVQSAGVPSQPSSPRPKRDALLGAILGLVLATIAAFVRDALDKRLHNAQEIHDELGLPILGRIGETSFAYPGLVATENLGAPHETDFEAFRVLRMNLGFLGEEGKAPRSILVSSPLPQEGKTSVSISLASAAALTGASVLLVECDLRRPSFEKRMPVKREPGLTDYLSGDVRPTEILQVVDLRSPRSDAATSNAETQDEKAGSMVVIPAGRAVPNAPELLQSDRFGQFLEKVSRAYDLVILDGSPLLSVSDPLELVGDADAVLICVRVQQTTRDQVRAARSALAHVPERPTGVVVTGLRRGDESYEYYYGY